MSPYRTGYQARFRRGVLIVGALMLGVLVAVSVDVTTGPSGMSVARLWHILLHPETVSPAEAVIVWNVRLPYALMAILVGAALALSGCEMQTTLMNPLASPFTLGVSAAASFGAALAIVLGLGLPGLAQEYMVATNAFVFALASSCLLWLLASWRGLGVESLVLFGIALVFAFNALVALLQFVASQDTLQQLVFWTLGSLGRASWSKLAVLATLLLASLPFAMRRSWSLTALTLGEDRARSFGIDVGHLRLSSLVRVSLLAGVSVSFVGVIGFVGLVAPHIARLMIGEDHRFLLPVSALTGAFILSLASIASKVLISGVLIPVGIVTALVGIPFFVAIVFRVREGAA
ncbi:FecCD family ABC transporter permease [Marinobacter oulmenensis]|uniref:Iron complex transport system permease protein n=1 Tax=Marinobacter oulmenensis TaxID=643747 RepID=A0A840UJN0_9GAMM|nr:iron ABC transporter permease [Marinobacter oulmenensis]MBB5320958.1 iron complex transport system permease protein [Marinobacter oulmenensis]